MIHKGPINKKYRLVEWSEIKYTPTLLLKSSKVHEKSIFSIYTLNHRPFMHVVIFCKIETFLLEEISLTVFDPDNKHLFEDGTLLNTV